MMSSSGFSPGVFLSPPILASTPSAVPLSRFYSSQPLELFSGSGAGNRNSNRQKQNFSLTDFPLLVLDKIFVLLSDQDLRAFHQVSHSWKSMLESRVGDNNRRLELVRKVRDNKENILNGSKELPTPDLNRVNRERISHRKSEDLVLIECTNLINTSDASSNSDNTTENLLLTPTSRFAFQSFEEAEKSLKKGQKLFRCRRCSGPVPSPILAGAEFEEDKEESDVTKSRIEATRCRLTSRMGNLTPEETRKLLNRPGRKKSRTFTAMPPPLSPIDIPTTVALGDRVSKNLVISGEICWSPAAYRKFDNIVEEAKDTSSLSMGIDLHSSRISDASSIDVKLNFTNSFDSSFSPFRTQHWKDSQISMTDLCLSDSELSSNDNESSTEGKSSFFPNLIPSPQPVMVLASLCGDELKNTGVQKDLMKPITLISSAESSVLKFNLSLDNYSSEHDKYDIDSSTYEGHKKSIYDINSNHDKSLIICGDKEKYISFGDVSRSLVPSLSCGDTNKSSCNTSDYFSSIGSMLRDGSQSYFPEISTGRFEINQRSLNDSAIFKTQSLEVMTNDKDADIDNNVFSLSSVSCPNLNESFVLECPNPSCSFRFCSTCSMGEHLGRPCRIIDSESFEELNESNENKYFGSFSQNNKSKILKNESLGTGKGKGTGNSNKDKASKKSLRRIAKL